MKRRNRKTRKREAEQKPDLLSNALPVQKDDGENAPDGHVVHAGVTQDALTDRLAQNVELLHEQHEYRQRGNGARHADAQHELPRRGIRSDPSGRVQHDDCGSATENERHAERKPGRDSAFAAILPDFLYVEFDAGDPHEHHHCPPCDAVERLHHIRIEDERVIVGKHTPDDARTEQDAGDDLHHYERRVIFGTSDAPYRVGDGENHHHRDQKNFSDAHMHAAQTSF